MVPKLEYVKLKDQQSKKPKAHMGLCIGLYMHMVTIFGIKKRR